MNHVPVDYSSSLNGLRADHLVGFFEEWPVRPSPEQRLEILNGSSEIILARSEGRIVGFITAISDGVLAAYIPLLEVRREMRGRGIGTELASRMLERLAAFYMIDVICDADVLAFYERLGLRAHTAMILRNRHTLG